MDTRDGDREQNSRCEMGCGLSMHEQAVQPKGAEPPTFLLPDQQPSKENESEEAPDLRPLAQRVRRAHKADSAGCHIGVTAKEGQEKEVNACELEEAKPDNRPSIETASLAVERNCQGKDAQPVVGGQLPKVDGGEDAQSEAETAQ